MDKNTKHFFILWAILASGTLLFLFCSFKAPIVAGVIFVLFFTGFIAVGLDAYLGSKNQDYEPTNSESGCKYKN